MDKRIPLEWILVLSLALWGALFYDTIAATVSIWHRSETFTHCFIILPICIYLIHQRWAFLKGLKLQPQWWMLLPLAGMLMLWLVGSLASLAVIEQGAAFAILPLMLWCVLGNQAARQLWFVLLFWMFSVPAGEFLIPQLQELTADITVFALQLTQIPVYREGLYIAIPGGLFEVAVACSGIRYLIASFTLGALYAYLNYRSAKKRIIFVLFSLALPLLANGIRAYGIVMIAHLSDMQYATGVDHLIYGWFFFGIVIFIMFAIGNRWADPVEKAPELAQGVRAQAPVKVLAVPLLVISLGIAAIQEYQQFVLNLPKAATPDFARQLNVQPGPAQSWMPSHQNPDKVVTGTLADMDVFISWYGQNRQGKELINSVNKAFNEQRWSIVNRDTYAGYRVYEIVNAAMERRLVAATYMTASEVSPIALTIKLAQLNEALGAQSQAGLYMALSLPVDRNAEEAKASLVSAMTSAIDKRQLMFTAND